MPYVYLPKGDNTKQETKHTTNISHQKAWCSTSLSYSTMAPTNSTFEVHFLMWCAFHPHLWQICLGHCRMKALVSTKFLRCSAPDQALVVWRLEWCACRPVTLPRRPSPIAAGAVPCTTWDMVIISDSSFVLRSPIAVLNSSREGVFDPPSYLHAICCRFLEPRGLTGQPKL